MLMWPVFDVQAFIPTGAQAEERKDLGFQSLPEGRRSPCHLCLPNHLQENRKSSGLRRRKE